MSLFDFKIDTMKADVCGFNNAISFLRYIDVRCNWAADSYGEKIPCFNEEQLTAEELGEWLNSVYVFIERCPDFYLPNNSIRYNFDMPCLMKRYFEIYILISFLVKQESGIFYYESEKLSEMQKRLTDYVKDSHTIQKFLDTYSKIIELDVNKYKDYGRYIGEDDFLLDCFPFKLCKVSLGKASLRFAAMSYIISNGKIYQLSKNIIDEKYFAEYFNANSKYKKEFYDIISAATENYESIKEYEDRIISLYEEYDKISDINEKSKLKTEIEQTENIIDKLSGIKNLKEMISECPEILPYTELK